MFKWIAKRALPLIAANIDLDIDTVQKKSGVYLRVRIESFGFVLLDRIIKMSDEAPTENPIDIFETGRRKAFQRAALSLPEDAKSVLNAKTLTDLK